MYYRFSFIATNFRSRVCLSLDTSVHLLCGILTLILLNQVHSNILGLVGSDVNIRVMGSIQRLVGSCVYRGSMIGSDVFGRSHIFGFEHKSGSVSLL